MNHPSLDLYGILRANYKHSLFCQCEVSPLDNGTKTLGVLNTYECLLQN